MKTLTRSLLVLCLANVAWSQEGFTSLFNGRDLNGWDGDPQHWKVEPGVVIGTCSGPGSPSQNTFLIWRGGRVKDFELRATLRVVGDNNSGIQYRSRPLPSAGAWGITGYQCDIHPVIEHLGMTYEERGRGIFGLNGQKVLLDPQGARWLLSEHAPARAEVSAWNDYTIVARGNQLIHRVNGQVSSELIDTHEAGRTLEGLLAVQLHAGHAHRVEIRRLELKPLPAGEIIAFDPATLPAGAKRIERPRTSNPQGKGKAAPTKK